MSDHLTKLIALEIDDTTAAMGQCRYSIPPFKVVSICMLAIAHFKGKLMSSASAKYKCDHLDLEINDSLTSSASCKSNSEIGDHLKLEINDSLFTTLSSCKYDVANIQQKSLQQITKCEFDPYLVQYLPCINRDLNKLQELGGIQGLAGCLCTDLSSGLSSDCSSLSFRRKTFGANVYPQKKGRTLLEFMWEACTDTTLIILMVCACLSLGFGIKSEGLKQGWYDGTSIAIAVILVALVTAISNFKQSRQFQKLAQARANITVQVMRENHKMNVSIQDIVVGDIVELRIGDQVPADGLFVSGYSLAIDESSFTGENDYFYPHSEQSPFLRAGSTVQDGYGTMLVTSVGTKTEWGQMMSLLCFDQIAEETPLQVRLSKVSVHIGTVGLIVAFIVLVVLLVFYFTGHSTSTNITKFRAGHTSATDVMNALVHIFSVVVTIIVVAVPEGLPLAVTLTLAYSMRKMMSDNALVRKLAACETMGSATTICSDKTGTLTTNQMTVVKAWVTGRMQNADEQHDQILKTLNLPVAVQNLLFQSIAQNTTASVTCDPVNCTNDVSIGSPTDKAILTWGLNSGLEFQQTRQESTVLQVETFNSAKKRAGVLLRRSDGRIVVHWKGAAEIILFMCNKWLCTEDDIIRERPISGDKRSEIEAIIESMAVSSLRCVAFAYANITQEIYSTSGNAEPCIQLPEVNLTLLAIVGMKDPCRPGVKTAVETVKTAGVKVMMVTGDNLNTAKAIAMECGIVDSKHFNIELSAVDGVTFRNWNEVERRHKIPNINVVARALPSDKLLLVETLKSMGEVVAVTGDGTNDAPALHNADIGLSMGIQGTEVAKESSDIIILDDNFTTITNVVRWGRSIYFNIQKFLQFQLTVNVAALVINFVAAVTSGDVPLTAVQLLWVNLIMDTLGALALATESPTDELLARPPVGRKEPLITVAMWKNIIFQAAYQVIILLTLQFTGVDILQLSGSADSNLINHTIIFNTFVFCQLFNEVNARQPYRLNIFHGILKNHMFLAIMVSTLVLQILMVECLEKFAGTTRLDLKHWMVCIGLASLSWPIGLLAKVIPIRMQ